MLPSDELADLRDEAELALPGTCTIQTPTETNTKGSVDVTYTNTYTGVPCRVAPANYASAERLVGEKLASISQWMLTVAFDQDIAAKYRVIFSGAAYEVTAALNTDASWRTVRRALLAKVE